MDRIFTETGLLLTWLIAILQSPTPPVYIFLLLTIITAALLWLVLRRRH